MNPRLTKLFVKTARRTIDNIDAGNSEISEEEAMDLMSVLCHEPMTKDQACSFLNTSRSNFGKLMRKNRIPKGRKRKGSTGLVWYKDELQKSIKNK